jgi:hypothetical protein
VHLLSKVDKEQCNCIVIKPGNRSAKREELPASVRNGYDRGAGDGGLAFSSSSSQERRPMVSWCISQGERTSGRRETTSNLFVEVLSWRPIPVEEQRGRRHNQEMEVGGARLAPISPENNEHNKAAAPAEGIPTRCAPKSMNPQQSTHTRM